MDASVRADLRARLAALAAEHAVPGTQLVIHHDERTWSVTTGVARHGCDTPMTESHAVPVGSVTKVVTAAAVLALVGDGDLDLDEPMVEQVPGLGALPGFAGVTPRHLLSHTSGLPSDTAEVTAPTLRRLLQESGHALRPVAAPGTAFSYSNVGYLLLGHAVEFVTGMDWAAAVRAVVLDPLGVRASLVVGPGADAGVVSGHTVNRSRGLVRPVAQSLTAVQSAAGALAMSATELVRLGRALAGAEPNDLLDPGSLKEMRGAAPGAEPFGMADGWGLGLAVFGSGELTATGHDGTGDGTSAHLRMNPSTGTVVAFTANAGAGYALWRELAAELPAFGVPIADHNPVPAVVEPVPAPRGFAGAYANGDTVYRVADDLRLTVDDEPFADLTPLSGLRFAMRDCDTGETDQVGRFLPGPDGAPAWLQVGGRLACRVDAVLAAA
ncbi:serine hydrolase domain-containing protein [Actinokineospora auranticolor]|uniref:CubicO group peptidase (Beta-lactamase class C family) n=1 Tax=Actinokineospora auranticolor TaxID=155976 RepID=A0A2S6GJP6_9PSEU|nr:serine hydrolase domain-containing protein [Actinokineospora auranticolor]PPK65376.1 CubicO group peptidase (beta-lactamase class C family) [Actinokineospora auranticolor]